jgi:RHS repeat-associated protein
MKKENHYGNLFKIIKVFTIVTIFLFAAADIGANCGSDWYMEEYVPGCTWEGYTCTEGWCCYRYVRYCCDGSIDDVTWQTGCIQSSTGSCADSCERTAQWIAENYPTYGYCSKKKECNKDDEGSCPEEGKKCPKDERGNPVSVLNGENKEVETDVEFNTPHKKGFKFYRTYKSQSAAYTTLGHGWTHNYNVILSDYDYGDIGIDAYLITDESGRTHHYRDPLGTGTYTGFFATNGTLVAEADGSFTWYRANDIKYTFNQQLQCVSKEDGNGNVQTLTYDTYGRLETVTDQATGRNIGFVYNADGLIDYITGPVTAAVPDGIWVSYQYDTEDNLTHVTYADDNNGSIASGFEYIYQDSVDIHNLTEKRNLNGEFLSSWTYDTSDRVIENVTRDGKGVTISGYDTSTIVVTDAQGVEKHYTIESINGYNNITEVSGTGCAGCGEDAVRYDYDDHGRINEIEYANGRIDTYSDFDGNDRYHTETQNAGTEDARTFYYDYHPDTGDKLYVRESSVLAAGDKETVWDYDDDGNSTANEAPTRLVYRKIERGYTYDDSGSVVSYEYITTYDYDASGNVTEIDGPLAGDQDAITYTYDPVTGDRLTETRPLVGTTTYTYDAAGNIATVTDINGVVTTVAYDGRNRQLSTTRNGITASRTYTAAGELSSTTDALSRTLGYTYSTEGFLEKITDPAGDYLFYDYNDQGRRIEESIHTAGDLMTHFRGTDYGTAVTNPAISAGKPYKSLHYNSEGTSLLETTYGYDASGNLTDVTDANTNQTAYQYDLFNRLTRVTQPGSVTTTYAYDLHGNLASVTDGAGNITTYTYDDLGRLVSTQSPDTGTTRYSYDENGNLRYKVQNGNSIQYQYDLLGRLTNIVYSDTTQNVTLTYDTGTGNYLLGRLASVTDPAGTVQYSYDGLGNLITETRTINSIIYVTSYGYDDAGNLRAIVYPTGQTIAYQADTVDPAKIAAVVLNPSGSNDTLASSIAYQPFGPASNMVLGNNVSMSKSFDLNYQLQDLLYANGSTVMDRTYTQDNVGNITAVTDNLDATRSQGFAYDDLYRLTCATGIFGAMAYTYDNVGNRLTRTRTGADPAQDSYTYYAGTNRLHAVTGTHAELIQYDDDGNTTTRTPGAANPTPAVTDPADYIYNSAGQRVKKTNSAAKIFHYDQSGQLIAETDATGVMLKAYVWLHGQPLAMLTPDGSIYYYHNDHLGTPQRMTDQTVTVVWAADYLPFGQADVNVATVENNLRFAGQYFDEETGLHYNWHRYYDPGLGRFLRPDPSHSEQSKGVGIPYLLPYFLRKPNEFNNYSYVQNNPLQSIDPFGLAACGSGLTSYIVPDTPFGFQFTHCCENHDDCYGGECQKPKERCDKDFYTCMIWACSLSNNSSKCYATAKIYYQAVVKLGGGPFNEGRGVAPCCQPPVNF